MIALAHFMTEQEHQRAFEHYWKARGITVESKIEEMATYKTMSLRSDLVMKVPQCRHNMVYGIDRTEIKQRKNRKWMEGK